MYGYCNYKSNKLNKAIKSSFISLISAIIVQFIIWIVSPALQADSLPTELSGKPVQDEKRGAQDATQHPGAPIGGSGPWPCCSRRDGGALVLPPVRSLRRCPEEAVAGTTSSLVVKVTSRFFKADALSFPSINIAFSVKPLGTPSCCFYRDWLR